MIIEPKSDSKASMSVFPHKADLKHMKAYLDVFVSKNTMAYFIFFENMTKYDLAYLNIVEYV